MNNYISKLCQGDKFCFVGLGWLLVDRRDVLKHFVIGSEMENAHIGHWRYKIDCHAPLKRQVQEWIILVPS